MSRHDDERDKIRVARQKGEATASFFFSPLVRVQCTRAIVIKSPISSLVRFFLSFPPLPSLPLAISVHTISKTDPNECRGRGRGKKLVNAQRSLVSGRVTRMFRVVGTRERERELPCYARGTEREKGSRGYNRAGEMKFIFTR